MSEISAAILHFGQRKLR